MATWAVQDLQVRDRLESALVALETLGRTGRPDAKTLATLTDREYEILRLMAEGRSNSGICERVFLSHRTVESHVRSIFRKLGLEDAPDDNRRVLAVLAYFRAGPLEATPP